VKDSREAGLPAVTIVIRGGPDCACSNCPDPTGCNCCPDSFTITTNASGEFSTSVRAGRYGVTASKEGFESKSIAVTVTQGEIRDVVIVLPERNIAGVCCHGTHARRAGSPH